MAETSDRIFREVIYLAMMKVPRGDEDATKIRKVLQVSEQELVFGVFVTFHVRVQGGWKIEGVKIFDRSGVDNFGFLVAP